VSEAPGLAASLAWMTALVMLPGWAAVVMLRPETSDPWLRAGVAAGLGVALAPLSALWLDSLGVSQGRGSHLAVIAASAVVIAASAIPRRGGDGRLPFRAQVDRPADRPATRDLDRLAAVAMLCVVVAVLAARVHAVRDVTVPMWGDSVHHATIVRLFAIHSGLPSDWLPLAPLSPLTYHFGLHALTAAVADLSGAPAHTALIAVGQGLMVLQALTAYALAAGLTGRPWAGIAAAVAAGGLGTMPGYYVNWGRYTQLAGQVVLPVACLLVAQGPGGSGRSPDAVPRPRGRPNVIRSTAAAAWAVAGLALTHYLVVLFLVPFAILWWPVGAARRMRSGLREGTSDGDRAARAAAGDGARDWGSSRASRRALAEQALAMAAVAAAAVLLAAPWIPRFAAGRMAAHAAALASTRLADSSVWGVADPGWVWSSLGLLVGWPLLGAAALAAVWCLYRQHAVGLVGLAWSAALVAAAHPGVFGLQVTGLLKDFTVLIGLYVPLSLVLGAAVGDVFGLVLDGGGRASHEAPARGVRGTVAAGLAVATVLAGAWAAWSDRDPVEADSAYATAADVTALEWIAAETPRDARFLVSAHPAFGDTVYVGDDGGWWIPVIAGRATTLPPVTYGLERSIEPGWRPAVNALNESWLADLDAPETRAALEAEGVGWAYVGPRARGLTVEDLVASPHWDEVYGRDGAHVFRATWVTGAASGGRSERESGAGQGPGRPDQPGGEADG